jgi:hypothetical protein
MAQEKKEAMYRIMLFLASHPIYWCATDMLAQEGKCTQIRAGIILQTLAKLGMVRFGNHSGETFYQATEYGIKSVKSALRK